MDEITYIAVESISQEREYIEAQRCECGGIFRKSMQALMPDKPADMVEAKCENCGTVREFWFDISAFFGK